MKLVSCYVKTFLCLLALLTAPIGFNSAGELRAAHVQQGPATGIVRDADGEPLPGASVVIKGTAQGTMTDIDGKYNLPNVANGTTLVITFVGYDPQEVVWNGQSLETTLSESTQAIDEVVVTGYGGTQQRSKVTSSISKVGDENLKVGVHSNPAQALSGAVSGLRVVQSSGNPGATPQIILRGGTDWGGSGSPLVMVDGQLRGSLSDINPEDIETMDVLKDAGATALYGARAANGVILITTKQGKAGHSEINFKARVGLNYLNLPHEFMKARDYLTWYRRAYDWAPWAPKANLTGATPLGTGNVYNSAMQWNVMLKTAENAHLLQKGWEEMPDPLDPNSTIIFKETDPADYNFNNPALTQDYNLNFSGGNDKGNYYAGLGYNNSEGQPLTSFYRRYSLIFNGSYKINSWLKSTTNFNYNRANWRSMPGSQGSEANYFGRILSVPHTVRYTDEEGNPTLGPNTGDGNQSFQPEKYVVDNQSDKFTMIQSFEATIVDGLKLKGTANWYYSEQFLESFTKDLVTNTSGALNKNRGTSATYDRDFSQTYNLVLDYNKTFASVHSLGVMLGMETYDLRSRGFGASGSGAPTDDFQDLGLTLSDAGKRSIDSYHSQYRIASSFGRLNYDFASKYLLSGVFRYDGYSSLLGDNRWGFFPGVSAGWVFSREDFARNMPWLSFGKLRTSYGVNGNATGLSAYGLQGSYNSTQYNGNVGFLIGTLPNPGLRWERTNTFEVGLDVSFLMNRINANFTFYNRLTSDKYANFDLPPTTGFSSIQNNNGKLRNRGLEIELSGDIIKTRDFRWHLTGNITFNRNMVIALPDNGLERNRQGGFQIYTGNGDELEWVGGYQEGQEPGIFASYIANGLYRTEAELPTNYTDSQGNLQGKKILSPDLYYAEGNDQGNTILLRPGDIRWEDINGDGNIDIYDMKVLGNTNPHWFGGFNTSLSWKGLTLYARFDYALGFMNYDNTSIWYMGAGQGTYGSIVETFDSWTPENPNAKYPRYVYADQLGVGNYFRTNSMFAFKGNYLAVRELSLMWNLPATWLSSINCHKLELSVTGQNLGYITKAPVAVPETVRAPNQTNNSAASGTGYPLPRTLLFGLNLSF